MSKPMQTPDAKTNNKTPTKKPRKWLKRLSITAILVLTLLSLLPLAIEFAAEKWLKDNGVQQADISNVDLNLFTGHFAIDRFQAGNDEGETFRVGRLSIDFLWQPLFNKRIVIDNITLNNTHIDITQTEQGGWKIGKLVIPQPSENTDPQTTSTQPKESSTPWDFGLNSLRKQNVTIRFHDRRIDTQLTLNSLVLQNIASWDNTNESNLNIDANIDGAQLQLNTKAVIFTPEPQVKGELKLNKLEIGNYINLAKQAGVTELTGQLSTDLAYEIHLDQSMKVQSDIDGTITLDKLVTEHEQLSLKQNLFQWEGSTNVNFPANADENIAHLSGALSLQDSKIHLLGQNIAIKQEGFTWEGELNYGENTIDDTLQPKVDMLASVIIEKLGISDTDKNVLLTTTDTIELKKISVKETTTANIAQLIVANAVFVQSSKSKGQLAQLGSAIVTDINSNQEQDIHIKSIQLNGLNVDVARFKNGEPPARCRLGEL